MTTAIPPLDLGPLGDLAAELERILEARLTEISERAKRKRPPSDAVRLRQYTLPQDACNLVDQLHLVTGRPKPEIVADCVRVYCLLSLAAPGIVEMAAARYPRR